MTFERIYRENLWRGLESRSGPGSGTAATHYTQKAIAKFVADHSIKSVLDVGCGDGYWMPDLPGYVGYDPTRQAIQRARELHPDREFTRVWPVRPFDLVILRDVVQHLTFMEGVAIVQLSILHAARWFMASTFTDGRNRDIRSGEAYSPDLTKSPFVLPVPTGYIFDGYGYDDPDEVRDPAKQLGLWRMA